MSTKQSTRKSFLILSFGIFISVLLHTSLASSSNDHLQDPASSGDYVKVEKVLRPWDPYTDFVADQSLEESSKEKRGSAFYPLRGKKSQIEDAIKEKLDELSDFYMKNGGQKKAMAFFPVRGRKASNFVPTRGRRGSAFTPMRGKKDEESSDAEDSYWKNAVDVENDATSSPRHPEDSRDLRDMELTLTQEFDKSDDHTFTDGEDKRGQAFFGSRGKKRRLPFAATWWLPQRLRPAADTQGSKREALFFASRGKRSSDVVKP